MDLKTGDAIRFTRNDREAAGSTAGAARWSRWTSRPASGKQN
jgi:hypothetical protein